MRPFTAFASKVAFACFAAVSVAVIFAPRSGMRLGPPGQTQDRQCRFEQPVVAHGDSHRPAVPELHCLPQSGAEAAVRRTESTWRVSPARQQAVWQGNHVSSRDGLRSRDRSTHQLAGILAAHAPNLSLLCRLLA